MTPADPSSLAGRTGATPRAEGALRWLRGAQAEDELLLEVGRQVRARRRRRNRAIGGAVAAVAVVVGGLFVARGRLGPDRTTDAMAVVQQPVPAGRPTATVSAPERVTLPDGSLVELKSGAEIAHEFTADSRRVTLVRGEAHFQVAKNPARPFVVSAGGVAVRAVGTAFSVQLGGGAVEVLVTEGRVAVGAAEPELAGAGAAAPTTGGEAALLQAGGRAVVRLDEPAAKAEVSVLPEPELAQRLAWRVSQLEFSRTPLPEIVALMNRHGGGRRIVIDAPAREIAEVRLSGFLAADNVDGLVRLLESNFPIAAERTGAEVRLRKIAR
jgi:transmembrane sensor